jgi:hypothetical protein
MGIYRGPGGPGDATGDATNEALKAIEAAAEAELSRDQAAASAVAAANSATSASTSDSDATAQASAAASSASAAATSASSASTSATSASSSASAASISATNAASSETNAETSATAASNSASAASTSASSASTSATTATNEANDAEASAVSALSNAITTITKASEASTSASNAATSETNASGSATAAATSETNASNSATSASTSETNAATSATNAASSASSASTSASTATTQATNAATSASNASTSASAASTSETNASNSASAASTSAANAAASYDDFDDRYLGAKATAPTLDNDGDALITGALYFDTVDNAMKIWDGSVWLNPFTSISGALIANNNLSDLNDVATARTNLGLGTAATTDSTAYATAAQGALADSALQSYTETDPVYIASSWYTTTNNSSNWDTAYSWGNHASAGYLTSLSGALLTGDIGVTVQGYDADTTKNDVANTFTANQVISVTDNTNAALRVTQTGTGDALLVEDATNPDSTPFVIDANGNVGIGTSSPSSKLDVSGTVTATAFEGDGSGLTGLSSGYTDADALSLFNVSGSAPVYACRAWANIDGTGTVAIRESGNVSSITDEGTGRYTVNFTTAMPDTNYSVVACGGDAGDGSTVIALGRSGYTPNFQTGSVFIISQNDAITLQDKDYIHIAIFR